MSEQIELMLQKLQQRCAVLVTAAQDLFNDAQMLGNQVKALLEINKKVEGKKKDEKRI